MRRCGKCRNPDADYVDGLLTIHISSPKEPADGRGTKRLRLRNPTAFSTKPFSLPEQGLQ